MSAPLTNSVLLAVTAPSNELTTSGDPVTRADLWTGAAGAYLKRQRRTVVSGGQNVLVARDVLTILDTAGGPVGVVAGADWEAAQVTVRDERALPAVVRTFTVDQAEHRQTGSIADSLRLELSAETSDG